MRIDVGRENSTVIELQVDDLGFGPPVLLLHGWPHSSRVWEPQVHALLAAGHRVVVYDRRGFGRSSRCSTGFDFDTLADDLRQVLDALDLRGCALVGQGMGCGEVLRYLGNYGGERLRAAALVAPLPPVWREGGAGGGGLDGAALDALRQDVLTRRHEFLAAHVEEAFAPAAVSSAHRLGAAARQALWLDAAATDAVAMLASLQAWRCDFRDDLPRIGLPTLVLQGSADRHLPPHLAGEPLAAGIAGATLRLVPGATQGLLWTHTDEVNDALLTFLGLS